MPPAETWLFVVLTIGWSQSGRGSPIEYEPVTYHPTTYKTHKDQHYHQDSVPKYNFEYEVRDDHYGPNFGAAEARNGHDTKGSYFVDLPDGRRQTVTYYVSKDSGFVANVTYELKGKIPRHAPQKNLAKGYRKPEFDYQDILEHVHHPHAELDYEISEGDTYFLTEPVFRTFKSSFPTPQQSYQTSDQIFQTFEPDYQILEQSSQTPIPNNQTLEHHQTLESIYLPADPVYKTSIPDLQEVDPTYRNTFSSPTISTHSSTEAFNEPKSKFDGSNDRPIKPSHITRNYQEIPAPKPVIVSPETFSNDQSKVGESQQATIKLNGASSNDSHISSLQGNRGETVVHSHTASTQGDQVVPQEPHLVYYLGDQGQLQISSHYASLQGNKGQPTGSLQQAFLRGNQGQTQESSHHNYLQVDQGQSQGSSNYANHQGNQGQPQDSSQHAYLRFILDQPQGSSNHVSLQGNQGQVPISLQHAPIQENLGQPQGSSHHAYLQVNQDQPQGSSNPALLQGHQDQVPVSSHHTALQVNQGEAKGSSHFAYFQGNSGEQQGSFQQSSSLRNHGASQGFSQKYNPRGIFMVSPGDPNQSSDLGTYDYQNINFYPNSRSYNEPNELASFIKPPKTLREMEQYNIDAAEYI